MELENNEKSKFSVLDQLGKEEVNDKKDVEIPDKSAGPSSGQLAGKQPSVQEKDVGTEHSSVQKDKLNYLSKYFKPILFLSVVVIFVLVYFILISPLLSQYQTLSSSLTASKEQNLQQQEIYNELYQLNKIYDEISPYSRDKVLDALSGQPELPNLYYNLEQLATDANYKLLSFSIDLPELEGKQQRFAVQPININLTLKGIGYLNFKNFLNFLEHNLRLIDATSITYDPAEEEIELSLKTYYYQ